MSCRQAVGPAYSRSALNLNRVRIDARVAVKAATYSPSRVCTAGLLDVQATAPGACMAHIAPWPPTVRLTRAGSSLKSLAVGGDGGCAASGGVSLSEPPPQADSPRHSVRTAVSHKLSPHRPACEVPFIVARAAMAQARAPRRRDHNASATSPAANIAAGCGSGTGAR